MSFQSCNCGSTIDIRRSPRQHFFEVGVYRNWCYKWIELSGWNGICLTWSRDRFISPSLPVGDDGYLNLSSQKRPTGRNHLVRRSGTTARGTVVLLFCLRMRKFPLTLVLTHSRPQRLRSIWPAPWIETSGRLQSVLVTDWSDANTIKSDKPEKKH